jgi:hypothetical protein
MHPELKHFAAVWLRVALAALAPVVLAAFVALPAALQRHPGEPCPAATACAPSAQHMT